MKTQKEKYKYPINNCNYCNDGTTILEKFCDVYYVMCKRCKNSTVDCDTPEKAIKEWNIKNERNNN